MIRLMWLSRLSNICWSPINGQSKKICRLLTNSQVLLKGMDTNFRIVVCKLISLQDKIFILLLETRVSRSQDMCPGLSLSGNSPVSTSKHCVYRQPTYCIILGRKQNKRPDVFPSGSKLFLTNINTHVHASGPLISQSAVPHCDFHTYKNNLFSWATYLCVL